MRRSLRILPGLLLLFAACGDGASTPGGARVTVSPDRVSPFTDALPAWQEGGSVRPVAAIQDGDRQVAFVENEILVATDDMDALDAFVERWNGVVVDSFDPAEMGLDDVPRQHVVRIDPDPGLVGPATLEADLALLAPELEGEVTFSSEAGMRLFAVVAAESVDGTLEVDVSWIARPALFADYETEEAPQGTGFRDAFTMKHLRSGGAQDTGVVEAWIALERADRLGNRVRIGIIDGGFSQNEDTTVGRSWTYAPVGSSDGIETPNPNQCSGGNACPWHGTGVVHAAAGTPDNQFGSAGTAGPIADVDMRHTPLDHGSIKSALGSLGASDIINMSFGGSISSTWQFSIDGYRDFVQAAAEQRLIFAAAGNSGDDMDDSRINYPCEFNHVICVGALGDGTTNAAGYSNFGSRVDIWAPGTNVRVGPDPSTGTTQTRTPNGTSIASPFAAGVAALIMAADPSLSRNGVEARLLSNAHTSSSDSKVESWVDARAAVLAALPNNPPQVYIEDPMEGASFDEGSAVMYRARVDDLDSDVSDVIVSWSHTTEDVYYSMGATMDGEVLEDSSLCAGSYVVQAEIDGGIGDSVALSFDPLPDADAPAHCAPAPDEIVIDSPSDGAVFAEGDTFSLSASVNHMPPAHPVIWREGGPSGRILGMGLASSTRFGAGTHVIWVGYGDASDSVTVEVMATANTAPTVTITSPPDGEYIVDMSTPPTVAVDFSATTSDAEDGTVTGSAVTWSYRQSGTTTWRAASATGRNVTIDLYDRECRFTDYEVKAVATDSGGLTNEHVISVSIDSVGC